MLHPHRKNAQKAFSHTVYITRFNPTQTGSCQSHKYLKLKDYINNKKASKASTAAEPFGFGSSIVEIKPSIQRLKHFEQGAAICDVNRLDYCGRSTCALTYIWTS